MKSLTKSACGVRDFLEVEGLAAKTLVIYSADQGFFLGEHGLYDKRLMYEESIRMPLIVRWPGIVRPGARIGEMALNVDLAPTLIEAAGASVPPGLHGRSLGPLIRGKAPENWRMSFYYRYCKMGYGLGPIEGVRAVTQKLIRYGFADRGEELYDLQADPREMHNRIADPAAAGAAKKLSEELARLREELGAPGL